MPTCNGVGAANVKWNRCSELLVDSVTNSRRASVACPCRPAPIERPGVPMVCRRRRLVST